MQVPISAEFPNVDFVATVVLLQPQKQESSLAATKKTTVTVLPSRSCRDGHLTLRRIQVVSFLLCSLEASALSCKLHLFLRKNRPDHHVVQLCGLVESTMISTQMIVVYLIWSQLIYLVIDEIAPSRHLNVLFRLN